MGHMNKKRQHASTGDTTKLSSGSQYGEASAVGMRPRTSSLGEVLTTKKTIKKPIKKTFGKRRNTVAIEQFKHDYSHIKSTIPTARNSLAPGQSVSKRKSLIASRQGISPVMPGRGNSTITNTQDTARMRRRDTTEKNTRPLVSKMSSPQVLTSGSATQLQENKYGNKSPETKNKSVQVVNGPDSLHIVQQPNSRYLNQNRDQSRFSEIVATTLASSRNNLNSLAPETC